VQATQLWEDELAIEVKGSKNLSLQAQEGVFLVEFPTQVKQVDAETVEQSKHLGFVQG
jgi:hypothetical protein